MFIPLVGVACRETARRLMSFEIFLSLILRRTGASLEESAMLAISGFLKIFLSRLSNIFSFTVSCLYKKSCYLCFVVSK